MPFHAWLGMWTHSRRKVASHGLKSSDWSQYECKTRSRFVPCRHAPRGVRHRQQEGRPVGGPGRLSAGRVRERRGARTGDRRPARGDQKQQLCVPAEGHHQQPAGFRRDRTVQRQLQGPGPGRCPAPFRGNRPGRQPRRRRGPEGLPQGPVQDHQLVSDLQHPQGRADRRRVQELRRRHGRGLDRPRLHPRQQRRAQLRRQDARPDRGLGQVGGHLGHLAGRPAIQDRRRHDRRTGGQRLHRGQDGGHHLHEFLSRRHQPATHRHHPRHHGPAADPEGRGGDRQEIQGNGGGGPGRRARGQGRARQEGRAGCEKGKGHSGRLQEKDRGAPGAEGQGGGRRRSARQRGWVRQPRPGGGPGHSRQRQPPEVPQEIRCDVQAGPDHAGLAPAASDRHVGSHLRRGGVPARGLYPQGRRHLHRGHARQGADVRQG